jgi:lactate 2-monooxygenase
LALVNIGARRQAEIFRRALEGHKRLIPIAPEALERAALAKLGANARAYLAGGAGLERTMAANRSAFDRVQIVPRMLRDVSQRETAIELFGRTLPVPFLLGPIGVLDLAHRQADLAASRAAAAEGITFVVSTQSRHPLERIAEAPRDAPRWFQLYWSSHLELTKSFVRRAERAGYDAIVVTLDTNELAWRPRDLDNGYLPFLRSRGIANYLSDPVFRGIEAGDDKKSGGLPRLAGIPPLLDLIYRWPEGIVAALRSWDEVTRSIRRFVEIYGCPSSTWDDLKVLRDMTGLPILLKGILHPADALRAIDAGMDGVIVSNHGGRQVDGGLGALDALPSVVDAVDRRIPVLFDSGIRTGADIVKALCLGATAVLIGRPYVYGLALAGEDGVRHVIRNLAAEFDLTMGLSGRRKIDELDRTMLATGPDPVHSGASLLDRL